MGQSFISCSSIDIPTQNFYLKQNHYCFSCKLRRPCCKCSNRTATVHGLLNLRIQPRTFLDGGLQHLLLPADWYQVLHHKSLRHNNEEHQLYRRSGPSEKRWRFLVERKCLLHLQSGAIRCTRKSEGENDENKCIDSNGRS